jgi:hypothetical protein
VNGVVGRPARRRALALAAALALVPLAAATARAQGTQGAPRVQDARLESRVDARTRAQLVPILDSARRAGLPLEPLVDKALEGATKGASRPRIVGAVRTLSRTLAVARDALGRGATEAEIVAAADALEAGVPPRQLGVLRIYRGTRSVAVPLAVMADLVARGVPADTAARSVLNLAQAGAADALFVTLRVDVERDIGSGIAPATAVVVRSEASITDIRNASKNPVAGQGAVPATP